MRRLALLILALASCTTQQPPPEVTPVGSSAWIGEVEQAMQEWDDIGCQIVWSPSGRPVSLVPAAEWSFPTQDVGVTTMQGVYILEELPLDHRHSVLLHELGHVLGFPHRDHGIMLEHADPLTLVPSDCERTQ